MLSQELIAAIEGTPFNELFTNRVQQDQAEFIPARYLPSAIFDELVLRHGPCVVHVVDLSGPSISAEKIAALYIEYRMSKQLPMPEGEAPFSSSDRARWLASTMALEARLERDRQEDSKKKEEVPKEVPVAEPATPPKGSHVFVSLDLVEAEYKIAEKDAKERRRKEYLDVLRKKHWRILRRAQRKHLQVLDGLQVDFPNFNNVIEHLRTDLMLQIRLKSPLRFSPLLLLGPPGVGKTAFARELAARLKFVYQEHSISSLSGSFVLAGSYRTWSSADIGLIAKLMLELEDGQGIFFLLDELDKMQEAGRNHPLGPVLLSVLEPRQAENFYDEYLALKLNIAPVFSWIATANDVHKVPDPMRSRLQIMEVRPPSKGEMPAVLRSIDRNLRQAEPRWEKAFALLEADALKAMEMLVPRVACSVLRATYGLALRDAGCSHGQVHVRPKHIQQAIAARQLAEASKPVQQRESEGLMAMTFVIPVPGNNSGGSTPPSTLH